MDLIAHAAQYQHPSRDGASTTNDDKRYLDGTKVEESTNHQTTSVESAPWSVFTVGQKQYIIFVAPFAGFLSPLSADMYFPALNELSQEFEISSTAINLTLTSYMICQGLAPTIFDDFADIAGRRPAYLVAFAIYIGACVGLAC